MARRVPANRIVLTLVALLLLINSFLPTNVEGGGARGTNPVERWASFVLGWALAPVRGPLYSLSTSLRARDSPSVVTSDGKEGLKQRLGEELRRRSHLEQRITFLEREVQRLTGSRRLVQLESVRLEPANVTGLVGDAKTPMLALDAGRSSGIRPGLAVVAGAALVGRVDSASQTTARAQLITAAGTEMRVRIQPADRDSRPGAVVERIGLDSSGKSFIVDLGKDTTMRVNDLAHLADERWPWPARGFIVGKVVEFRRHPQKELLLTRAVIEPTTALRSLSRVTVLVPDQGAN